MNLLEMSFSGSVIILVVAVIRIALMNRLPKKVFPALWGIALLRLLIPFSFPAMFSIYSFMEYTPVMDAVQEISAVKFWQGASYEEEEQKNSAEKTAVETEKNGEQKETDNNTQEKEQQKKDMEKIPVKVSENEIQKKSTKLTHVTAENKTTLICLSVWMLGMFLCGGFFLITYIICCREFRTSLPVKNTVANEWLKSHRLRRPVSIRQTDCISTPLTYGIFHPVILMPKTTVWEDSEQLQYILEHEFVHIQRLDAVTKLFLTAAVCVHWFNPFVWGMYVLANRDIELSCDETVIRRFGEGSKSAYALTLINMEETKRGLITLGNNFSRNAIEERITAIMKIRKTSVAASILAVVLIPCVAAAFATSAVTAKPEKNFAGFNSSDSGGTILSEKNQAEVFYDESGIDIETDLSEEEQKELLKEYEKYGVYKDNGILYYGNEPVRCLIDKYKEERSNGNGGWNVSYVKVYTYFNENGEKDVYTIRDYKTNGEGITKLFKNVIDIVPTVIYDIIPHIPEKSRNRIAEKAAEEGDYHYLEEIACYIDRDVMDEIAREMIEKGKSVEKIAPYISENMVIS